MGCHTVPPLAGKLKSERPSSLEFIYYTLTGIALYVLSDWILQRLEIKLGKRLEYRSLIFFGIILTLALISFSLIRWLAAG